MYITRCWWRYTAGAKVVSIPNFAFGGGKRGTMVANTSEYYVPNYAGGGDAIFNQDMIKTLGLPSGAQKLRASSGYIPNFARMGSTAKTKKKTREIQVLLVDLELEQRANQLWILDL